jgi:hypothetical protein
VRWRERLTFALIAEVSIAACAQSVLKIEIKQTQDFVAASGESASLYTAKVILPDGTHAKLSCLSGLSTGCGPIGSFHPEQLAPDNKKCTNKLGADENSLIMACTMTDLGFYEATRQENELIIVVPSGTVQYHIDSSW